MPDLLLTIGPGFDTATPRLMQRLPGPADAPIITAEAAKLVTRHAVATEPRRAETVPPLPGVEAGR